MQATRSTLAAVALAAAATLVAARSLGVEAAQGADPLRERAEELARAASQQFGEVLKEEAQDKRSYGPAGAAGRDKSWGAAGQWLERSSEGYKSIVRRLSQAAQPAPAPATPRESPPATNAGPQAIATPSGWLSWSSERFRQIMRKLAQGAAPPEARQSKAANSGAPPEATAPPENLPGVAAKVSPAARPGPPAAAQPPSRQADFGGEERKLAQTRRAEAAKREAEVAKTEAVLRADQQKKAAEAKARGDARKPEALGKAAEAANKAEEERRAANAAAKKAQEEAHRLPETQVGEDARTGEAAEVRKAAQAARKPAEPEEERHAREARKAERAAEAKMAVEAARQRGAEARRLADQKAKDAGKPRSAEPGAAKAAEAGKTPPGAEKSRHGRIARAERGRARACETAGTAIELPGWYVVKAGDTLWSIAERHYGAGRRYKRIFAANRRRIRSPHWIEPCQRIYLPRAPRRT
jgi:nucleoid-associated protein YgaU